MPYTKHGHWVGPVPLWPSSAPPPPPSVARCGGPGLCQECSKESYAAVTSPALRKGRETVNELEAKEYREKAASIFAMQFTGGGPNASRIINWLWLSGGITARWHEKGCRWDGVEHIDIDDMLGGTAITLYVGDWITRDSRGGLRRYVDEDFHLVYEEAVPAAPADEPA